MLSARRTGAAAGGNAKVVLCVASLAALSLQTAGSFAGGEHSVQTVSRHSVEVDDDGHAEPQRHAAADARTTVASVKKRPQAPSALVSGGDAAHAAGSASSLMRRERKSSGFSGVAANHSSEPECVCKHAWKSKKCSNSDEEWTGCPDQACDEGVDRICAVEKFPCWSSVDFQVTAEATAKCDDASKVGSPATTTPAPAPSSKAAQTTSSKTAAPATTAKPTPVFLCECDRELFYGRLTQDMLAFCYQQYGCSPTTVTTTNTLTTTIAPDAISVCEDHGHNRTMCKTLGCCSFDGRFCWSAVGGDFCHKAQESSNVEELFGSYPERRGCMDGVRLFDHDIYGNSGNESASGWSKQYKEGLYNFSVLGCPDNQTNCQEPKGLQVKSVRVHQGCELMLYESDGFQGEHTALTTGTYSLSDIRFAGLVYGSTVRSMKVKEFAFPTPAPTPMPTSFGNPDSVTVSFRVDNLQNNLVDDHKAKAAFQREVMEEISAAIGQSYMPEDVGVSVTVQTEFPDEELPVNIIGMPVHSGPEADSIKERLKEIKAKGGDNPRFLEVMASCGLTPGVDVDAIIKTLKQSSLLVSIGESLAARFGCGGNRTDEAVQVDATNATAANATATAANATRSENSSTPAGQSEGNLSSASNLEQGQIPGNATVAPKHPKATTTNTTTAETTIANTTSELLKVQQGFCVGSKPVVVRDFSVTTEGIGHPIVKLSMTLENLDFVGIQENKQLQKALKAALVKQLAIAAFVTEDQVSELVLSEGPATIQGVGIFRVAVKATATIRLQHLVDKTVGEVAQHLESRASADFGNQSLPVTVSDAVREVADIETITQGNFSVSGIEVNVEEEGPTTTTRTTTTYTESTTTTVHQIELAPVLVRQSLEDIKAANGTTPEGETVVEVNATA